jgi:hypothetical protein
MNYDSDPHCASSKKTSLAVGVTMGHKHFPRHYPGHNVHPTLSYRTRPREAWSRNKWLRTAVAIMRSCSEMWKRFRPVWRHNTSAHDFQNTATHEGLTEIYLCTNVGSTTVQSPLQRMPGVLQTVKWITKTTTQSLPKTTSSFSPTARFMWN